MKTIREKPLGHKSYGSIPHLVGSRRGPRDYGVNEGQQRICCERARDKYDEIIVQEKLDGANVGIALKEGQILGFNAQWNFGARIGFRAAPVVRRLGAAKRSALSRRVTRRRAHRGRMAGSGARHDLRFAARTVRRLRFNDRQRARAL